MESLGGANEVLLIEYLIRKLRPTDSRLARIGDHGRNLRAWQVKRMFETLVELRSRAKAREQIAIDR